MKKTFLLVAGTLFLAGFSAPAMAQDEGGIVEATKEILDEVIEETTEILTGEENDDPKGKKGKTGNENALEQIDKNLEKHGGEHKGLENARDAVSKNKSKGEHDGNEGGIIEEIADDIKEEIEETGDDVLDGKDDTKKGKPEGKSGKPANAGNKGKGKP